MNLTSIVACTVCMGAPGDPLVQGANNGIWVLLGVIFFVQILFVALFVTFWKRSRQLKRFREQFRVVHAGTPLLDPEQQAQSQSHSDRSPRWFRRSLAALGINFLGGSQ